MRSKRLITTVSIVFLATIALPIGSSGADKQRRLLKRSATMLGEIRTLQTDRFNSKDKVAYFSHGKVRISADGTIGYSGLLYEPNDIGSISFSVDVCKDGTIYRTDGKPSGSYKIADAKTSKYDTTSAISYTYPDGTVVVKKERSGKATTAEAAGIIIIMADGRLIETSYNGDPSLVRFVPSKRSAPPGEIRNERSK
jgi:hypothetical protein